MGPRRAWTSTATAARALPRPASLTLATATTRTRRSTSTRPKFRATAWTTGASAERTGRSTRAPASSCLQAAPLQERQPRSAAREPSRRARPRGLDGARRVRGAGQLHGRRRATHRRCVAIRRVRLVMGACPAHAERGEHHGTRGHNGRSRRRFRIQPVGRRFHWRFGSAADHGDRQSGGRVIGAGRDARRREPDGAHRCRWASAHAGKRDPGRHPRQLRRGPSNNQTPRCSSRVAWWALSPPDSAASRRSAPSTTAPWWARGRTSVFRLRRSVRSGGAITSSPAALSLPPTHSLTGRTWESRTTERPLRGCAATCLTRAAR